MRDPEGDWLASSPSARAAKHFVRRGGTDRPSAYCGVIEGGRERLCVVLIYYLIVSFAGRVASRPFKRLFVRHVPVTLEPLTPTVAQHNPPVN